MPASRVCPTPGCPRYVPCAEHARPNRQARGYDAEYERERAKVMPGATHCGHCGEPFTDDNPATAGHVKALRHGGTASDGLTPTCARCNYGWRATGL